MHNPVIHLLIFTSISFYRESIQNGNILMPLNLSVQVKCSVQLCFFNFLSLNFGSHKIATLELFFTVNKNFDKKSNF